LIGTIATDIVLIKATVVGGVSCDLGSLVGEGMVSSDRSNDEFSEYKKKELGSGITSIVYRSKKFWGCDCPTSAGGLLLIHPVYEYWSKRDCPI
jgi:hypothetical protein